MTTANNEDSDWDYTKELDDDHDTIQFGKYRGMTPVELLNENPGYIIWATENTHHWVGSDDVIHAAYAAKGKKRAPTAASSMTGSVKKGWPSVEEFENAMLEAFGEFPKPLWK